MTELSVTITSLCEAHIPAVTKLIVAQERRHHALDARLRPASQPTVIEQSLHELRTRETPLVALDGAGHVRGYVQPSVWELSSKSILHSFLTARNGIAQRLALPSPEEKGARDVFYALLAALDGFWQQRKTTGDLIRWPSVDVWFLPELITHGFQLDSMCAWHPWGVFPSPGRGPASRVSIRPAKPVDEEALVQLFDQELHHHERYLPFVRSSPGVLGAFRRKLARLWDGLGLEDKAPLVLVAEVSGEVVGMAENTLLVIGGDDPGFTAPGRYWCIVNVSVRATSQGQGIGQLLLRGLSETAIATYPDHSGLDGYLLWYNPDNPEARLFWKHRGFLPLWTTYQRLSTNYEVS